MPKDEETNEKKPGFMDNIIKQAMMKQQDGWDKCSLCNKSMMPGTPMNKLYDDKLGSLSVCVDCSLKAILWYARKLKGDNK